MSVYQHFRRMGVPQQAAQRLETTTLPAPTRGLVLDENYAYMQPGGAVVLDNWKPTLKGIALRGGCVVHCQLPDDQPVISAFDYDSGNNCKMFAANYESLFDVTAPGTPVEVRTGHGSGNYASVQLANQGGDYMVAVNDAGDYPMRFDGTSWVELNGTPPPDWANSTAYAVGDRALDTTDGSYWACQTAHTSSPSTPPDWVNSTYYPAGVLVHDPADDTWWGCFIGHNSAASGTTFAQDRAANPNYWGGYPPTTLTFGYDRGLNPSYWAPDMAPDGSSWITGPIGSNVESGLNLVHVCKYKDRLFFIEKDSFNAWFLPINSVGGALSMIPLSGAATKGGKLLFAATWSLTTGGGIDDKIVFGTTEGELIVFSGTDPSNMSSWAQQGRYQAGPPLGMNAHLSLGGDLLLMTTEGIVPISSCINKSYEDLELAAITHAIRPLWRDEVSQHRNWPWTMHNWETYGGIFITTPGKIPGACLVTNGATGAFARYIGYDATCFIHTNVDDCFYFGTQDGKIMQADVTGYDNGLPYVATMVGGWEVFQSPAQTITWRQARASFAASYGQFFQPQLSACTDYVVTLPPPPQAGPDPGPLDVWDEGLWGPDQGWPPPPPSPADWAQYAQWDQPGPGLPVVQNTMWISIGVTGFSHAPIVQVTVAQHTRPDVELIAINALFERAGFDV